MNRLNLKDSDLGLLFKIQFRTSLENFVLKEASVGFMQNGQSE
jgi:hypothetical protein